MNLSPTVSESLRNGITGAKLDLRTGPECHDHEPAAPVLTQLFGWDMLPAFDRVAEKAYWHVMEHQPRRG